MNIEWSSDKAEGIIAESSHLRALLHEGKNVLWLVAGGSNIPVVKAVLEHLKEHATKEQRQHLTITLTDERYGHVGHPDSNWQQLLDAGFDFGSVQTLPVLTGKELEETVAEYAIHFKDALETNVLVAHFGMGTDGHIAGILPHSIAVAAEDLVCGYEAADYTRITFTAAALLHTHAAYLFAYGAEKEAPLRALHDGTRSLLEQPVQLLRNLPEVHIYTDHLV